MKKIELIEIISLLKKYENWVVKGKIQFLRKDPETKAEVLSDLNMLIKDFKSAKDKARKNDGDISEYLDWNKTHQMGRDLWHKLASSALNNIDDKSKGKSALFDFLDAASKFEDILYGLEPYYRDHTLHSLWVYFLGEHILRDHIPKIHENLVWYLFNDIEDEKEDYDYGKRLVSEARKKEKVIKKEINEHRDAVWCIIALCHDLGYSLSKLNELNKRVKEVLGFFDIPDLRHVGYSLDIEHQYLISQFLELMSMDVRIVPSENYRDKNVKLNEKVLIKSYRDDPIYWELCRAFEKKQHGILSAFLLYKILSMFGDAWVREPSEIWGLGEDEVKENIIYGNILYAIAQHTLEFTYLKRVGSLAEILVLADELEEFSRYGRQLQSRKYYDTMAYSSIEFTKPQRIKDVDIKINYIVAKHRSLGDFFVRKAERLCRIYSLEEKKDKEKGWRIKSIKITAQRDEKSIWFYLDADPGKCKGFLPETRINGQTYHEKEHDLICQEDKIYFKNEKGRIILREWFKNLVKPEWKDDLFLETNL